MYTGKVSLAAVLAIITGKREQADEQGKADQKTDG